MKERQQPRKASLDLESWTFDGKHWSAQAQRDRYTAIQGDAETRDQAEALALLSLARMQLQSSGLQSLADILDTVVEEWSDGEEFGPDLAVSDIKA